MHVDLSTPDPDGIRRFTCKESDLRLTGTARLDGRTAELLTLDIRALESGRPVSAAQVRMLPVGKLLAAIQSVGREETVQREVRAALAEAEHAPAQPVSQRRGGRPPITPELLRQVAEAYLEETAEGKPPRALGRIAERFDRPQETIRTWLARARKEGWLAPAVKGRLGGEPGPRLIAHRFAAKSGYPAPGVGETLEEWWTREVPSRELVESVWVRQEELRQRDADG